MRKADTHDFKFLPVTCPRCRMEGKVKIGRLDKTFICKQCKRPFHVDPDGVVSGDREIPVDHEKEMERALKPRRKSALEKVWEKVPRPAKTALGGVILLASILGWQIYASGFLSAEPLPEGLQERAKYVADCFAKGDKTRIKAISAAGTSGDAANWITLAKPEDWPGAFPADHVVNTGTKIAFESYEKKSAGVATTIAPGKGFSSATLMLYFALGDDQQWYFDGKRSVKEQK